MKKAKNKTAHAIKSIAERMANMACGSASAWGMYQPKEPKKLDKSKSSYAYGTTTCSGKDCTVSVTYHGTTKYGSGYGYANAKNSASGSGTRASSYHTAGGYSTNISY